jgi:hypothetical protein
VNCLCEYASSIQENDFLIVRLSSMKAFLFLRVSHNSSRKAWTNPFKFPTEWQALRVWWTYLIRIPIGEGEIRGIFRKSWPWSGFHFSDRECTLNFNDYLNCLFDNIGSQQFCESLFFNTQ